jgi:HSP20 family protein
MASLLTRGYDDLVGFHGLGRMFTDFERLFRELDQGAYVASAPEFRTKNTDNTYELSIDLPGVPENEVKLQIHNGVLTISGARKLEVPAGYQVQRRERRGYEFSRSFTLPKDADGEQVTAAIKNGVLNVVVSKRAEVKPRQIPVTVG